MPYVDMNDRYDVDSGIIDTPGKLNYAITKLVLQYLPATPRYADYNSVVGVLESAKLEFYRRAVSAYETKKMLENGDVYPDRSEGEYTDTSLGAGFYIDDAKEPSDG